jgi:peroxiredoxin
MPHLQAMANELGGKGLVVLGISTDDAKLDAAVKPLVKSKGITYTILRDPTTTVVSQYNPAKTLPFNVLVAKDGSVAKVHAGYNPGDEVTLKAEVVELLAK